MTSLDTLLDRNQSFAKNTFSPGLQLNPFGKLLVIGCVDPRVDPAAVLGLELGEAGIIRNVGGRITPATVKTIGMLGKVGQANNGGDPGVGWNLVVLHHTDCGMTDLAAFPDLLAEYFQIDADQLPSKAVSDPHTSVQVDAAVLHHSPLPAAFTVSGLVYDVDSGHVELVVPPAPLREQ